MTPAAFWDKIADKYARDPISDPDGYQRTLTTIVSRLEPHHTVLELGCGTGSTALELAGSVAGYTATDVSPRMIEIAKAKLGNDTPPQLRFAVSDAGTFAEPAPDVILALNLLHLLPDAPAVLQRFHDALPSGGLFIAKTALLRDGAWFLPLIIPVMRMIGKAPFVRSYSESELTRLIQDRGFVIEESLKQPGTAPRLFTIARKP